MKTPRKKKSPVTLIRPRVYVGESLFIGPGKINLLRAVSEKRSISAGARALGIPYKRAWLLINSLNQGFGRPVVETSAGGRGGGGTSLTDLGRDLLQRYTDLEKRIDTVSKAELDAIRALLR